MPANRNALIRYKTIDNCLRNRFRKWTLEDLIDACSDALYEYEGIDKGVSRRTVQLDIQAMRSDKLGYAAPIVVEDKKYYTYEDPSYSITNIPLTNQDLGKLTEVVDILKQFKGFTHFQELSGIVQKLEDKIHVSQTHERPVIDLEKNEHLKGLEYIDPIFQAVLNKVCLQVTYQSFKAREPQTFEFHPALLKEHRNRWFILGKKQASNPFMLLALDRIQDLATLAKPCLPFEEAVVRNYFRDVVGVSVNEGQATEEVRLFIQRKMAPYLLTKPLHHSQQVVERNYYGVIISLQVQTNVELERDILGYGDAIMVLAPISLKRRIYDKLRHTLDRYQTELGESWLTSLPKQLAHNGHAIASQLYTNRLLNKLGKAILQYRQTNPADPDKVYAIRNLLSAVPALAEALRNNNLRKVLAQLNPRLFLTKAIYFDKPAKANWYVTWHQDQTINVREKIETEGFSGWTHKDGCWAVRPPEEILQRTVTLRIHLDDTTAENGALRVLPGSHKQRHSDAQRKLITENAVAQVCEVARGGVHIMKPLILHASSKANNRKKRRVIHLEFCDAELPNGLEWAERMELPA